MVKVFFNITINVWNERCQILQAQKNGTADARARLKAHEYCTQLRKEAWKLHSNDRHLLRRTKQYFFTTSIVQLQHWEKRVRNALTREREAREAIQSLPEWVTKQIDSTNDISASTTTVRSRKIPNTTIVNTTAKLKQTILPFCRNVGEQVTEAISRQNNRRRFNRQRHLEERREARDLRQSERIRQEFTRTIVQSQLSEWMNMVRNRIRLITENTVNTNTPGAQNNNNVSANTTTWS